MFPSRFLLLLYCLLLADMAHATCTATGLTSPRDEYAISLAFGTVKLLNPALQPPGTVLASTVVPATDYHFQGAGADDALWICDREDLPLDFLVANNADSRFGGLHEADAAGEADVYATWFFNVGLRQRIGGVTLTRRWQKVPLSTWREAGDKIHIRVQDIPPMQAELYRVRQALPPDEGATRYCGDNSHLPSAEGAAYPCPIATAYLQLAGTGLEHDVAGAVSEPDDRFYAANNGIGYRLYNGLSLASHASCVVNQTSAQVAFPAISVQRINAGETLAADVGIGLECSRLVISGTGSGQTALGLQASAGAVAAAQQRGLVTASGGVRWLLSDEYDSDPALAQGVGIQLYTGDGRTPLAFVGQADSSGGGSEAGWMPVLQGALSSGDGTDGNYAQWRQELTAVLARLPGHKVTPGKVRASVNVLVKLQ